MASLTLNFTPPTTPEYNYVNEYRVRYWPTNAPSSSSTVFTNGFPLVITDLNGTSYSGTIEAKCGSTYGSPTNFIATPTGGGGTPPACPYKITIFEDPSVSLPIGAVGNTTSCIKPGYRIKLTTLGDLPVYVTGSPVTISISYNVETGDCASPTVANQTATLTIPVGQSVSTGYIQVSPANERINGIEYGAGNPATIMTCNVTYAGGVLFPGGGSATLSTGTPCSSGYGNYNLIGTVGDVVRVRLSVSGLLSPTSTAWLSASMGSTNPNFSASGTTACVQPGGSSVQAGLILFKNITIPVGGTVPISTSIFTNNSTNSMMSAAINIISVNAGPNSATGTTGITGVCVGNSGGGSCPGASYVGD